MPQSLALLVVHIVFSTKDRISFLKPAIAEDMHAYLATVAREHGCECYRAGGMDDHVHLAIRLSRTITVADLVEELKTCSSKWVKARCPAFSWQRGYAAFSISPSDLDALLQYIDAQPEHHRKISFQEELRILLTGFGVEHDERYMWD